jgi:hypothetical protein
MPVEYIERDAVMLRVGPANGGIEVRLVADDGSPEHRLRLSAEDARKLLQLLRAMLEPPGAGMSDTGSSGTS